MSQKDLIYKRLYEGVSYRLRTFAGGRWSSYCRPTSIVFLLTERCNARCIHCDIWKNRGQEDSPSLDQWKAVVSDLRKWLGTVQITFSGGEALLKPYTIDLVNHAVSIGLFVEVLTHGYWNDQSKIEKLALAKPWRITLSFDGMGQTHSLIRGRRDFFDRTSRSIQTLKLIRQRQDSDLTIRLKTVIMDQNLEDVCRIARYASEHGLEVFYQPIEQNYNTAEDASWFEHSETWPRDTQKAVAVVEQLQQLKRDGLPIANSFAQLEAMIPYFRNPDASRIATQSHSAHEGALLCSTLTMLQFQANGEVTVCTGREAVGNIKTRSIREIWENRPPWWKKDCCLATRLSEAERQRGSLLNVAS